MNKNLLCVVNALAPSASKMGAKEMKAAILSRLSRREARAVSGSELYRATLMLMKRVQEAPSNMVMTHTTQNYYAKVECKYYTTER